MTTGNVVTILHEIKSSVLNRIRASELIIFEECLYKVNLIIINII